MPVDWRNFFRGIFFSFLPKDYWRSWRPSSTVDFARSAMASGLIECAGFLFLLVHGYFHFIAIRTQQLRAVEHTNEGTQLYWLALLTFEYLFHPLTILALGLSAEGALRLWAAFFTDEIIPSFPIKFFAVVQAWRAAKRREAESGPDIPDLFERSNGTDYDIRIFAKRPKDGWRVSITVDVAGEFHEIVRIETDPGLRPYLYVLRRLPAGRVLRGMYGYDPPIDQGNDAGVSRG